MSNPEILVKIGADASGLQAGVAASDASLDVLRNGFAALTASMQSMSSAMQRELGQATFALRSIASSMGEVGQQAEKVEEKVKPAVEALDQGAKKAKVNWEALGQKLASVGTAMTMSITAPMVAAGAVIFDATKKMDSMMLSLRAVAGSAEGANKQLAELREVAKLPGLGLQEAVQGSIRLQAAGLSADKAKSALMAFGNALATVGKGKDDLDGVTLALGQIMSKGKVAAEEINQLNERLPQIRVAMKDAFGTADTEALQKMGISSEEFVDKITASFAKLPKVMGGLQNDSENLADTWNAALVQMGEGLKPFFASAVKIVTALAEKLGELGKWFSSLSEDQKSWIVSLSLAVAAIGPALLAFGKTVTVIMEIKEAFVIARTALIALNLTAMANPWIALATAVAAVTVAVIGLHDAMGDLGGQDEKAQRSVESRAAKAKVDAYQHAYDQLDEGKEKDMVGRKLGLAKGELAAAIQKDDDVIKKGTTLEPGNVQGAGDWGGAIQKVTEGKGAYKRNVKPDTKGAKEAEKAAKEAEAMRLKEAELDDKIAAKKLKNMQEQEDLRIESITDEVERAREIRSKKYQEDIQKAQGNSALLLAVNRKYAADLKAIDAKATAAKEREIKERIELEKKAAEETRKAYLSIAQSQAQMWGTMAGVMDAAYSKQSTAYKAMFALSKAFTIAHAMLAMQQSIAEGMKAGWPQNIVLMAGAAAQGAAVIADVQSVAASFAVGTPTVPQDMVAQIHKGETIVPATFAEGIRRGEMTLGGPGGGKGSNHSASLVLPEDILAAIASKGSALVKIMNNQGRVSFA